MGGKSISQQKAKEFHAPLIEIKATLFDGFRGMEFFKGVTYGDCMCNWNNGIW